MCVCVCVCVRACFTFGPSFVLQMVTQYYVNHPSDRHGDSLSSSDEQDPQDYRIPSPAISDSAEEETSHLPPFILDISEEKSDLCYVVKANFMAGIKLDCYAWVLALIETTQT